MSLLHALFREFLSLRIMLLWERLLLFWNSASQCCCVVTAGAYCHCGVMWCACCWCGLWVCLDSHWLATIPEKSLWIKAQFWDHLKFVFRLEALLSSDQIPLASVLCPSPHSSHTAPKICPQSLYCLVFYSHMFSEWLTEFPHSLLTTATEIRGSNFVNISGL